MTHFPETTLELAGVLDVRRTAEIRTAVYGALEHAQGDLVVDLAAVEALDVTMLKVLAVANRVAERDGRRVVLRHCPPGVRRLLHLSHLRWMVPVEPDDRAGVG